MACRPASAGVPHPSHRGVMLVVGHHVAELDQLTARRELAADAHEVGPVGALDEVEPHHLLDRLRERPVGDQHPARAVGPHRQRLGRGGERAGHDDPVAAGGQVAVELFVRAHALLVLLRWQQRPLGLGSGQQHEVAAHCPPSGCTTARASPASPVAARIPQTSARSSRSSGRTR